MEKVEKVEAVERALSLLAAFLPDGRALSLAELAAATGFYKSTILRLAASLERFGYLTRSEETGLFRLGPMPGQLGAAWRRGFDPEQVIRPVLHDLVAVTGETASFYVAEGGMRVCLYRENSRHASRHHLEEGSRLPMTAGASSKILLAFGASADPAGAAIRQAGYAISLGERDPLVAAVAVPVLDMLGLLQGALTVSGLNGRFTPDRHGAALAALKAHAAALSGCL